MSDLLISEERINESEYGHLYALVIAYDFKITYIMEKPYDLAKRSFPTFAYWNTNS